MQKKLDIRKISLTFDSYFGDEPRGKQKKTTAKMKQYTNNTEETLVAFHIGRGGSFHNQGHVTYIGQDEPIKNYTGDLFLYFENIAQVTSRTTSSIIMDAITEAENNFDHPIINRLKRFAGIDLGKLVYFDGGGNPTGLDYDNDGTGRIDIDGDYNTTYVIRLCDCSDDELRLII